MRRPMMMIAAAAVLILTGCSGSDEGDAAGDSEPTTQHVTVEIKDTGGQDVLFNSDDTECLSYNLALAMNGDPAPAEVTLRDADGSIVGTQQMDETGGSWGSELADGCFWRVMFKGVPVSDFYEAEVTGSGETFDGRGEGNTVTVEF